MAKKRGKQRPIQNQTKKQFTPKNAKTKVQELPEDDKRTEGTESAIIIPTHLKNGDSNAMEMDSTENDVVPVGFSNLGNTCFFNSVMQCLCQTKLLEHLLKIEVQSSVDEKTLTVTPRDGDVSPLTYKPAPMDQISLSLHEFFDAVSKNSKIEKLQDGGSHKKRNNNRTKVQSPKNLFKQICDRYSQFRGFDQQDSQELLHILLDSLSMQEIKRKKLGILRAMKLEKAKPSDVPPEVRNQVKSYGIEVKEHEPTVVEKVFGGKTTSHVMCDECGMVRCVEESFHDISLPVVEPQHSHFISKPSGRPNVKHQFNDSGDHTRPASPMVGASKHAQKKARKQARRESRYRARHFTPTSLPRDDDAHNTATDMDGFASTLSTGIIIDSMKLLRVRLVEGDMRLVEADTVGISHVNGETVDHVNELTDELGSLQLHAEVVAGEVPEYVANGGHETALNGSPLNGASEIAVNGCHSSLGGASDDNKPNSPALSDSLTNSARPESPNHPSSPARNSDSSDRKESCSSDDTEDSTRENNKSSKNKETSPTSLFDTPARKASYRQFSAQCRQLPDTVAERYQPQEGELSVLSCLHRFTMLEMLTGSNKFGCETCTKQRGDGGGTVYCSASKQMLISEVSPVLVIHLKRFQQVGFSLRKVSKHVRLAPTLDLAPFCLSTCKKNADSENRIMYELYGVVEHSGSMSRGHYTAHVKFRSHPSSTLIDLNPPSERDVTTAAAAARAGQWYHISDTSVTRSSEAKALASSAYLLFYERLV